MKMTVKKVSLINFPVRPDKRHISSMYLGPILSVSAPETGLEASGGGVGAMEPIKHMKNIFCALPRSPNSSSHKTAQ